MSSIAGRLFAGSILVRYRDVLETKIKFSVYVFPSRLQIQDKGTTNMIDKPSKVSD